MKMCELKKKHIHHIQWNESGFTAKPLNFKQSNLQQIQPVINALWKNHKDVKDTESPVKT